MTITDKEELLKAIEQKRQAIWPTDTGEMKPATVPNNLEQGWLNALAWMKRYINSLPAEQPSVDLEDVATTLTNEIVGELNVRDYTDHSGHNSHWYSFKEGVVAGAKWQKEQTISKACEWLNKNVVEYHPRKGELRPIVNINAFREAMEKEDEQ